MAASLVAAMVVAVQKTKLFSQVEEERLCALLEVSASNLTTLLDACAFIFEQAAYYQINGDILASQLTEAGLGAEQVRQPRASVHLEAGG